MSEKKHGLDHATLHTFGYVKLLDVMGSDEDIVDAARISYDRRGTNADRGLIRYLLRHRHTSPFEMAEMKFEIKAPLFVARQWVRHRTASINEVSARYTQLPDEMFVPEEIAGQSTDNKQGRGSGSSLAEQREIGRYIAEENSLAYNSYEHLLNNGVARETARGVLNLNTYTKFVWKMDLHNLLHFVSLRAHPHAQLEIREYAEAIDTMIAKHFPLCHEAFCDYVKDAYTCSRMEVELVQYLIGSLDSFDLAPSEDVDVDHIAKSLGMTDRELTEFKERFFT